MGVDLGSGNGILAVLKCRLGRNFAPEGRLNKRAPTQCLSRPSGTDGVSRSRQPSDKSLGYCQVSLRDKGADNVFIHNTLYHQAAAQQ
jgi:hypothetical protein